VTTTPEHDKVEALATLPGYQRLVQASPLVSVRSTTVCSLWSHRNHPDKGSIICDRAKYRQILGDSNAM